jgi:hypothetical protein
VIGEKGIGQEIRRNIDAQCSIGSAALEVGDRGLLLGPVVSFDIEGP